jgi:hypothetical protein
MYVEDPYNRVVIIHNYYPEFGMLWTDFVGLTSASSEN